MNAVIPILKGLMMAEYDLLLVGYNTKKYKFANDDRTVYLDRATLLITRQERHIDMEAISNQKHEKNLNKYGLKTN